MEDFVEVTIPLVDQILQHYEGIMKDKKHENHPCSDMLYQLMMSTRELVCVMCLKGMPSYAQYTLEQRFDRIRNQLEILSRSRDTSKSELFGPMQQKGIHGYEASVNFWIGKGALRCKIRQQGQGGATANLSAMMAGGAGNRRQSKKLETWAELARNLEESDKVIVWLDQIVEVKSLSNGRDAKFMVVTKEQQELKFRAPCAKDRARWIQVLESYCTRDKTMRLLDGVSIPQKIAAYFEHVFDKGDRSTEFLFAHEKEETEVKADVVQAEGAVESFKVKFITKLNRGRERTIQTDMNKPFRIRIMKGNEKELVFESDDLLDSKFTEETLRVQLAFKHQKKPMSRELEFVNIHEMKRFRRNLELIVTPPNMHQFKFMHKNTIQELELVRYDGHQISVDKPRLQMHINFSRANQNSQLGSFKEAEEDDNYAQQSPSSTTRTLVVPGSDAHSRTVSASSMEPGLRVPSHSRTVSMSVNEPTDGRRQSLGLNKELRGLRGTDVIDLSNSRLHRVFQLVYNTDKSHKLAHALWKISGALPLAAEAKRMALFCAVIYGQITDIDGELKPAKIQHSALNSETKDLMPFVVSKTIQHVLVCTCDQGSCVLKLIRTFLWNEGNTDLEQCLRSNDTGMQEYALRTVWMLSCVASVLDRCKGEITKSQATQTQRMQSAQIATKQANAFEWYVMGMQAERPLALECASVLCECLMGEIHFCPVTKLLDDTVLTGLSPPGLSVMNKPITNPSLLPIVASAVVAASNSARRHILRQFVLLTSFQYNVETILGLSSWQQIFLPFLTLENTADALGDERTTVEQAGDDHSKKDKEESTFALIIVIFSSLHYGGLHLPMVKPKDSYNVMWKTMQEVKHFSNWDESTEGIYRSFCVSVLIRVTSTAKQFANNFNYDEERMENMYAALSVMESFVMSASDKIISLDTDGNPTDMGMVSAILDCLKALKVNTYGEGSIDEASEIKIVKRGASLYKFFSVLLEALRMYPTERKAALQKMIEACQTDKKHNVWLSAIRGELGGGFRSVFKTVQKTTATAEKTGVNLAQASGDVCDSKTELNKARRKFANVQQAKQFCNRNALRNANKAKTPRQTNERNARVAKINELRTKIGGPRRSPMAALTAASNTAMAAGILVVLKSPAARLQSKTPRNTKTPRTRGLTRDRAPTETGPAPDIVLLDVPAQSPGAASPKAGFPAPTSPTSVVTNSPLDGGDKKSVTFRDNATTRSLSVNVIDIPEDDDDFYDEQGESVPLLDATDTLACCVCEGELDPNDFYENEGLVYCETDYKQLFLSCQECHKVIEGTYVSVTGESFHAQCITCFECNVPFDVGDSIYTQETHRYCHNDYFKLFGSTCAKCELVIEDGRSLHINGQAYHVHHFSCTQCKCDLSHVFEHEDGCDELALVDPNEERKFFFHENKPFCPTHYKELHAPKCFMCKLSITTEAVKFGKEDQTAHKQCMKCKMCGDAFSADGPALFVTDKCEVFCERHYAEANLPTCDGCGKFIEGPYHTWNEKPYHKECLVCFTCKGDLTNKGFMIRDDSLHCEGCYRDLFAHKCSACKQSITDGRMYKAGEACFHPDCYVCAKCNLKLNSSVLSEGPDGKWYHTLCVGKT